MPLTARSTDAMTSIATRLSRKGDALDRRMGSGGVEVHTWGVHFASVMKPLIAAGTGSELRCAVRDIQAADSDQRGASPNPNSFPSRLQ